MPFFFLKRVVLSLTMVPSGLSWTVSLPILVCMAGNCLARFPYHKSLPPPPIPEKMELPPEQWFEQKLDHFDPTNEKVWKQRYFVNNSFYESGGPLFVMIGGEGTANPKWMVAGSWANYAKKFAALMIQVEHRFYGKSHPTENLTVESLRFLTSEQALADLAYFVTSMKQTYNLTEGTKVIAFGGSYPGSLAVWFRLKYPHIVHASVASSAPLIAKINFKEYLEVVHNSLIYKGSVQCLKAVNKATKYIDLLLQHRVGWQTLQKVFRLCQPLDGNNKNDVANLLELLTENFEDVVQYNEDNREFEGVKGTNITIKVLCDIMTNESIGNAMERYAKVNSLILNTNDKACLNHTYESLIQNMNSTSWSNEAGVAGRSWMYQTCTEFGFYQTSDSSHQPFGDSFPLQFFMQQCTDVFGSQFTEKMVEEGVKRTNIMYGGQNPKVTKVILINGSIDPWHTLSVTKSLSDEVPAIFINGTAHCANMYPSSPSDSAALKEARMRVEELIEKWLKEQ